MNFQNSHGAAEDFHDKSTNVVRSYEFICATNSRSRKFDNLNISGPVTRYICMLGEFCLLKGLHATRPIIIIKAIQLRKWYNDSMS